MSTNAYSKRGKKLIQIIYKINIIYPWTYKGRRGGCHPPLWFFEFFFFINIWFVFFRSRSLVPRVHFETRFGDDQFLWLRDMMSLLIGVQAIFE